MDRRTRTRLQAQARVLRAMAHPTRLLIVQELAQQEKCVHELTKAAAVDMSTVSRHLAQLRSAGIVADEKRSARVYYRLRTPCVLRFLECVQTVIESSARDQLKLIR